MSTTSEVSAVSGRVPSEISEVFWGIFESLEFGLVVTGVDGKITMVNEAMRQMSQRKDEFWLGKEVGNLSDILTVEAITRLKRSIGSIQKGKRLPPLNLGLKISQGKNLPVEVNVMPMVLRGEVRGNLISFRDASIEKKIEGAVEESEKRLRMVLSSIREGITLSDEQGNFLIYNPEMEQITGYSKEEAMSHPDFFGATHQDEAARQRVAETLVSMREGERRSGEVVITTKSKLKKLVSVSTTVIMDQGRKLFLSVYHDVTEQKESERQLMERNLQLEKLTDELNNTAAELRQARDHLEEKVREQTDELRKTLAKVENLAKFSSEDPFPVLRVSSGGVLMYANQASKLLLDSWKIKVGEVIPRSWLSVVAEVYQLNSRKIVEVDLMGQIISFVIVPVRSAGYVNMYGRDVTQVKEVEKVKNEFISLVSHQIRTPLTSIRWYSEMLLGEKGRLSSEQIETAQVIHETAVQLAELVNDLLNISRMESGRLEYEPKVGRIEKVVEEVVREVEPQIQQKHIGFSVQKPELSEFVFDEKLVRQVYMNLLSNAIKYTPEGGSVTLNLKVEGTTLVSEVKDTGIGIPDSAKDGIFSRFYRAQNAVDANIDGTGLGLSVAKMMVEKCGGKIWFESQEGVGSSFFFSLPMNVGT